MNEEEPSDDDNDNIVIADDNLDNGDEVQAENPAVDMEVNQPVEAEDPLPGVPGGGQERKTMKAAR